MSECTCDWATGECQGTHIGCQALAEIGRLREEHGMACEACDSLRDDVERLTRERDEARAALAPFAAEAYRYEPEENDSDLRPWEEPRFVIGDLRRAYRILNEQRTTDGGKDG